MTQLTLSKQAIFDLIIFPEVTSRESYKPRPIWPGGASGVTIGLGYDIGMSSEAQVQKDWGEFLHPQDIFQLQKCCGKLGIMCKAILPSDIIVPWEAAEKVFYKTSLVEHAKIAARVYDELEELHPYEQTAIVGLVYNRGGSLNDKKGSDRRKEMRQLVQAIKDDNDALMASIIRSMKRLWNSQQRGLLIRRDREAAYIEKLDLPIPESDKLYITV